MGFSNQLFLDHEGYACSADCPSSLRHPEEKPQASVKRLDNGATGTATSWRHPLPEYGQGLRPDIRYLHDTPLDLYDHLWFSGC